MSLFGNPNETLEIPSEVFIPSSFLIISIASRVFLGAFLSELTVKQSGSTMISFLSMPYSLAFSTILFAIFALSLAEFGIPFSSRV